MEKFFFSNLHPSSAYRMTGSSWYTGIPAANHTFSTYGTDYKSRYDDNYLYRRNNGYDTTDTGSKLSKQCLSKVF